MYDLIVVVLCVVEMLTTQLNPRKDALYPVDKPVDNFKSYPQDLWITSFQQVINNELTSYQQSY